MPVNPMNPQQEFVPADSVAVMVAEPPLNANNINRLPNPDGAYGAYGWTTDVSGHNLQTEALFTDPRLLPPSERAAIASNLTGNITVVNATTIQVDPAASPTSALRYPDGMTAVAPGARYQARIDRVPQLVDLDGQPIIWNVKTTPAAGAPATTPWTLELRPADVAAGLVLTPGTITPSTNAYFLNYGAHYRVEFSQLAAAETDVRTIVSSAQMGCVPGQKVNARLQMLGQPIRTDTGAALTTVTRQLWFNFYKADGTFISSGNGSATVIAAGITEPRIENITVPANAAKFTLNMRLIWPSDTPSVTVEHRFSRALVQMGAATTIQPEEFPAFRNIFESASSLTISRTAMGASQIQLVTTDATYDPAVSTIIRKGARAEISSVLNNLLDPINFERMWTGRVEDVRAKYVIRKGASVPVIEIAFTDGMADLASTPRSGGYADLVKLPNVLEGSVVPWNVTGQTGQSAAANIPDWTNDNAYVLDQVAITRDTHHAYAWLDRWGVFNVHDDGPSGTIDTYTREWFVDESQFGAAAVPQISPDDVINTVMIKALRQIGDQTEEWSYGPFEDRESIDVVGVRSATFTVGVPIGTVVSAGHWDAFVAEIFARNAQPYKNYKTLPFFIDGDVNNLFFATIDLGDLVNITSPTVGFVAEQFRVTDIKHTITPRSWSLELAFTKPDSVAAPTTQPDLKSTPAAWKDIPLRTGFTAVAGETPQYRVNGDVVWLRGRVQGSHTVANTPVGDIPADLAPGITNELWATTLGSATPARFFVNSSGVINVNAEVAGTGSVAISTSYIRK